MKTKIKVLIYKFIILKLFNFLLERVNNQFLIICNYIFEYIKFQIMVLLQPLFYFQVKYTWTQCSTYTIEIQRKRRAGMVFR